MNLDEQLAIYDKHAEEALDEYIRFCKRNYSSIIAGGRERLIEGYDLYAEDTWFKTLEQVHQEAYEEACDGTVYFAISRHKREM